MLDALRRDLHQALRALRRTPAFTITAILVLALSIGMASAMFTVFESVVLKRLPVQDPDQLVELSGVAPGAAKEMPLMESQFKEFKAAQRTLQGVAGFAHWGAPPGATVDGDRTMILGRAVVTGNFFQVLGAAPALGRLLTPEDEIEYAPTRTDPGALVAVISYDTWRRQFGADPSVIGRRLRFPQIKWNPVIVGVAPPGLDYPRGAQIWTPNAYPGGMDLIARLAPAASISDAREEYLGFVRRDTGYIRYGLNTQIGARAVPLKTMILGDIQPTLVALFAAVGLLLLLGCVNIGNLLLVRAAGRSRELAVRRALGAGRKALLQQLIAESSVIGVAGGIAGLGVAVVLVAVLVRLAPPGLARIDMIRLAPTPFVATLALSLGCMAVFSLLTGFGLNRLDLSGQLRMDSRSGTEGRRLRVVRQVLVGSQIALALVLLSGAGLLVKSFARLSGLDLGFTPAHMSFISVEMPWEKWVAQCGQRPLSADTAATRRYAACGGVLTFGFHDRLVTALHTVPGIEKASSVAGPPFLGTNVFMGKVTSEAQSAEEASRNPWIGWEYAGPEYFEAMGIEILRGRGFTAGDREGAEKIAVVSEGIGRMLWPGQDPIGKRLRMDGPEQPLLTVVGLMRDMHFRDHRTNSAMIVRPYYQDGLAQGNFVIRTGPPLSSLLAQIQQAIQSEPGAHLVESRTIDELIAPQLSQPRLNTMLLSAFATIALVLAAVGLYGIMSATVTQQTRELGVRMALGATAGQVRGMVLRQALMVSGMGALAGLAGALVASRWLVSMLFEISPTDPLTLVVTAAILLSVAGFAAYLPARRATRIDPASALRAE